MKSKKILKKFTTTFKHPSAISQYISRIDFIRCSPHFLPIFGWSMTTAFTRTDYGFRYGLLLTEQSVRRVPLPLFGNQRRPGSPWKPFSGAQRVDAFHTLNALRDFFWWRKACRVEFEWFSLQNMIIQVKNLNGD